MRVRLVQILALATAAIALLLAGCGGDDGGSGADPAAVVPAGTPVYIEATVRPEGELRSNIEALASTVAGIDDVGALILEEIEGSALSSGEDFDYATEVEPWLGEKVGMALREYDGDDFTGYAIAIQSTDTDATQEFVDKQSADEDGSYEGTDFKLEDDGTTIGIVDDLLVFAEDEASFKAAVDAAGDEESLADQETYESAVGAAPSESLADVFVDIGALIEESGDSVDADTQQFLETAGIEPRDATAIASLVPGAERIEVDFASNVTGEGAPTGDASQLLGSLPGGSFAAFAAADFGSSVGEAIDRLDEEGIPGEIPPNQLKRTMKAAGIDLEQISGSVGDVGVFAQGNTANNLTGALVLETTSAKEATNTVSNIGLLLRSSGTPGVTAIGGEATGFSVRSPELGAKPVIVAARGEKIAVSYGAAASTQALSAGEGATLAQNPAFEAAAEALDGTPISAFVAGPSALALVENMLPADELAQLDSARPFLDKVEYAAIGTGTAGELATAKLIVGFSE